jgi:hypothetical protein
MLRALCPTRLVMAMTLTAIAMLMASAGAQAHPGHDHGAQPAVPFAVYAAAEVSKAVPRLGQSKAQVEASVLAATKDNAPRASKICLSGCCQPGGAGCLTAWVVSDPGLPTPALLRVAIDLTVVERAGVKPDALPEPPNSLA